MGSPAAEIEVGEDLVRSLLAEQHPDLAELPLAEFAAGWDNIVWRLGDELLVRLPRRGLSAPLALHELRWLPVLAPRLPLPIPAPVRVGRPSEGYPWSWSVVPWLDGEPGDRATLTDPDDAATRLGAFLQALHHEAPPDAPANPYRGVPLDRRQETLEERLVELGAEIDTDAVRTAWEAARAAAPWPGPPVWVHGDLHPANVVIAGGTLAAVIDFGDLCSGDPATDVAAGWMLLPASAMPQFAAAYGGIDVDLESRARGWAVLLALMLLSIGLDRGQDRSTYETVARATLARLAGPSDR